MDRKKHILLVEDDDAHAEIFAFQALAHHPEIEIRRMRDGESILLFLDRHQEPDEAFPALIVLDLNLPRYNGLEVLGAIKAHPVAKSIPTVILTSSGSERDIARAWASGANSYLRKPLDADAYKPLVRLALDYWHANEADETLYKTP